MNVTVQIDGKAILVPAAADFVSEITKIAEYAGLGRYRVSVIVEGNPVEVLGYPNTIGEVGGTILIERDDIPA